LDPLIERQLVTWTGGTKSRRSNGQPRAAHPEGLPPRPASARPQRCRVRRRRSPSSRSDPRGPAKATFQQCMCALFPNPLDHLTRKAGTTGSGNCACILDRRSLEEVLRPPSGSPMENACSEGSHGWEIRIRAVFVNKVAPWPPILIEKIW
jgi:hypothetical protein